ncbi:FAD-binding oxidoreductase [Leifsonia sp. A12D58]|uniref:FAD-binding oxidoreductase n=1 Tax=Leifsonia sp. A12D58 TaxID=3397674 RepID=UPI0039E024E2
MTPIPPQSADSAANALDKLASTLAGTLILPGDSTWESERLAWNRAVDQHPVAVAIPQNTDDIALILATALSGGFEVAVQPRGHGANDQLAGCILVRTNAFDEISIDTAARIARIGSGVNWGSVLPLLDGTGLVALSGTNPDVTVAGYLLSGGHSWFSRWKGLAAHSIRAVELVVASGEVRRVTAQSDPDLLWALRGGCGLFGIVTTIEIDLFEAPVLYGGKIIFPGDSAEAVFAAVDILMRVAPDQLSIFFGLINMPDVEFVPEPLRGGTFTTVDVVFVGNATDGAALLVPVVAAGPVLMDTTREFSIGSIGEVSAEPTEPSATHDWSTAITDFDHDSFAALAAAFGEASAHGLTLIQLRPLGGAQSDPARDDMGVVGHLDSRYLAFAAAIVPGPGVDLDLAQIFGPLNAATAATSSPRSVPSMLSSGQDLSDAYSVETLERLSLISIAVDPERVLHSNRQLPRA